MRPCRAYAIVFMKNSEKSVRITSSATARMKYACGMPPSANASGRSTSAALTEMHVKRRTHMRKSVRGMLRVIMRRDRREDIDQDGQLGQVSGIVLQRDLRDDQARDAPENVHPEGPLVDG